MYVLQTLGLAFFSHCHGASGNTVFTVHALPYLFLDSAFMHNQRLPQSHRTPIIMIKLRRSLLALAMATTGLMTIAALPATAYAAAPQVKKSAPGYYRVMLGDFEITALSDGAFMPPVNKLLQGISPKAIDKALSADFQNPMAMSINAFLINTGSKLILVDTGLGGFEEGFGPGLNHVIENLKAAGYTPEQVDEVYITHMHPDHIGGLFKDGQRAFPNAIVRADQHETDQWLSQANMDKAPDGWKFAFREALQTFKPYVDAGQFKPFSGTQVLSPGITAVAEAGHTHGHTIYKVESKGQTLILWGDLMHVASVQFANPGVTIAFDTDNKRAAAARKRVYAEAAAKGYLIGAAHISFPGLGHMRAKGKGYEWVPVNYVPLY